MNQKGFQTIIITIVLLLIGLGSFYFFKDKLAENKNVPEPTSNQNAPDQQYVPLQSSKVIYSGNKKFALLITSTRDKNGNITCTKTIFDSHGSQIGYPEPTDFLNNITCSQTPDVGLVGFLNFSGDNLVFNLQGTDTTIFNIFTQKTEKISYSINPEQRDYGVIAVDTQYKYLLFSKDGYAFADQIKDYQGKEVFNIQPLLKLENNDYITSFYDDANHGILYLKEKTTSPKGFQFSYFDLKTKQMRDLKFVKANPNSVGRGCGGNSLLSETNRLVFVGGCLDAAEGETNSAGEIILNL